MQHWGTVQAAPSGEPRFRKNVLYCLVLWIRAARAGIPLVALSVGDPVKWLSDCWLCCYFDALLKSILRITPSTAWWCALSSFNPSWSWFQQIDNKRGTSSPRTSSSRSFHKYTFWISGLDKGSEFWHRRSVSTPKTDSTKNPISVFSMISRLWLEDLLSDVRSKPSRHPKSTMLILFPCNGYTPII